MREHVGEEAELFNSPLETGIRALILLDAIYPRSCDLMEMTWFDHLVVHTADLEGLGGQHAPSSLHPALPGRDGELFVRRRLVEQSLRLMQEVHLIDVSSEEDGVFFIASEDAPSFLDMLQAPYTLELKQRAGWLAEHVRELPSKEFASLVEAKVGRWTAEFGLSERPGDFA
ncbi:ABC-three component system middle component 2 [Sphingomonas faeni]|uniref:ABC-three component system middle component 2 n=1 Tax=Sphingomonas faeni TaxID=185950 RepID=UPI000D385A70|nr:ABC-three component system middle component 2 [Sphingomonas faeni]